MVEPSSRYSLIVPLYKAEPYLRELLTTIADLNKALDGSLEAILVLDGLADRSLDILVGALPTAGFRTRLVRHARNFGSLAAIRTGIMAAGGDYLAVMSADGQEPPDLIREIFERLGKSEADIIIAQRTTRSDPWLSRAMSALFWAFYCRCVQPEMPKGGFDVFGCNRLFRDRLLELKEPHNVLVGLVEWVGLRRQLIPYSRRPNSRRSSTWSFQRKMRYAMDNIFLFSDFPIRFLISLGWLFLAIGFIGGLLQISRSATVGFGVLTAGIGLSLAFLVTGANFLGLGILGSYLWRILENSRQWPHALIVDQQTFSGNK
jgi:glycosyltransferase involved in cell wall biosynthesis